MGLENINFGRLVRLNTDLSLNIRPNPEILTKLAAEATYDGRIADFVPIYQFPGEDLRLRGEVFTSVMDNYKDFQQKDQEVVANQLERAFYLAECAHQDQKRQSGDNYIQHCYSVALILAELGLPYQVVIAGLLHDTLEDTSLTADNIEKAFYKDGREINLLVEGCRNSEWDVKEEEVIRTIPDYYSLSLERRRAVVKEAFDTLTLTKLFRQYIPPKIFERERDSRIPFVKLADRLHNIRTIWGVSDERKRRRKAQETLEYYVPLARTLGWHAVATELEDLCFEVLEPEKYRMVRNVLDNFISKPYKYDLSDPFRHRNFLRAMNEAFEETTNKLKELAGSESVFFEFPGIYAIYKSWLLENVRRGFMTASDFLPVVKIVIKEGYKKEILLKTTAGLVFTMHSMGYEITTDSREAPFEGDIEFIFHRRKRPKKIKVLFVTQGKFEDENRAVSDYFAVGRRADEKTRSEGAKKLAEIGNDIERLLSSPERGERLEVLKRVLGGFKFMLPSTGEEIWVPRDTNYAVYAYLLLGRKIISLRAIFVDKDPISIDMVNRPISHRFMRLDYYPQESLNSMITPIWLTASDDPDYLGLIGDHLEKKIGYYRKERFVVEWEKEIRSVGEEKFARRLRNRPLVINLAFVAGQLRELGYDGNDNYASFFKDMAYGEISEETIDQIVQLFPLKGTDEWKRYMDFTITRKAEKSKKKRRRRR